MVGRKKKLPCPLGGCSFHGLKLKRHLISKGHSLEEKSARLIESHLLHKIKHMCKVNKHNQSKPAICRKSSKCLDRIDNHLTGYHQMHRGSDKLYQEIDKCKKITKEYDKTFFSNISDRIEEKEIEVDGRELVKQVKQLKHVKLLVKQVKLLKPKK